MAVIKKKTWPNCFEEIVSGRKDFEFRAADFEVGEDDTIVLEEWDPLLGEYTGRTAVKRVDKVWKFSLDEFKNKKVIEEKGFYIIRF